MIRLYYNFVDERQAHTHISPTMTSKLERKIQANFSKHDFFLNKDFGLNKGRGIKTNEVHLETIQLFPGCDKRKKTNEETSKSTSVAVMLV